jgi:hypothetical protein
MDIVIGKSCSPSKPISDESETVKAFLVSYGGGMGGSSVSYYGKEISNSPREGFIIIETFEGDSVELNQRFVVSVKDKQIVTILSDVTEHRNYNKVVCKSAIETRRYLLKKDAKYKMSDNIMTKVSGNNILLISKTLETT